MKDSEKLLHEKIDSMMEDINNRKAEIYELEAQLKMLQLFGMPKAFSELMCA